MVHHFTTCVYSSYLKNRVVISLNSWKLILLLWDLLSPKLKYCIWRHISWFSHTYQQQFSMIVWNIPQSASFSSFLKKIYYWDGKTLSFDSFEIPECLHTLEKTQGIEVYFSNKMFCVTTKWSGLRSAPSMKWMLITLKLKCWKLSV